MVDRSEQDRKKALRKIVARARLLKRYGITEEQFDEMMAQQDGVCAICHHPPKKLRLNVDHDHKTGRVRGLLCFRCNKYKVGTNDEKTAARVLAYLRSDFDGRAL